MVYMPWHPLTLCIDSINASRIILADSETNSSHSKGYHMTKNELITYVAAILTTALETEPSPFPESMAYLALGGDLSKWEGVKGILLGSGLITIDGHSISLTDKGRETARQCNAAMAR